MRIPGWEPGSWAYHSDDGNLFLSRASGMKFGDTYGVGDVIGCGSDMDKDELFFTKNGTRVGELLLYCFLVHKPDINRPRIYREIASWEAICSSRWTLQKFLFFSELRP
jgi:hypothetical protein